MTRQQRSHLFIIALVPVVVFAAVRCADSSAPSAPVPAANAATDASRAAATAARLAKLHEETDWIGQFHNDALAYVFTRLTKLPARERSKHNVCETARKAYAEFHLSRRGTPVPASVDAQLEGYCTARPAGSVRATALSSPAGPRYAQASVSAETLMDRIAFAVDSSTSYEDLSSRVNGIESTAASSLGYDEAQAVFTVGSIALNSATYWANSVTDWVPFTSPADYSVLLAARIIPPSGSVSPALRNPGGVGASYSWSSWATQVWNDTKAAAKRAAGGDVRGGAKALIAAGVAELPVVYDVVIASAAASSIGAVLQL